MGCPRRNREPRKIEEKKGGVGKKKTGKEDG
jgi:hypothetical protein